MALDPGTITLIAILASVVGSALVALIMAEVNNRNEEDSSWYDFYHKYIVFPEEYTDLIDSLLSDKIKGKVSQWRMISGGRYIPDVGMHYYYLRGKGKLFDRQFIGLEKQKIEENDQTYYRYRANISPFPWGNKNLNNFTNLLMNPGLNTVRYVSIDISGHEPKTMIMTKICKQARYNQKKAIRKMLSKWTHSNNFNLKVMISGVRGVGKTYTAALLKKEIERLHRTKIIRLYDDFDPSAIGVNIKKMALQYATITSPVILTINEVDIMYRKAVEEVVSYDPREQHTRTKQTFNNMMDAISNTEYTIAILTTEKTPQELYQNENYRSFMRKGRIDMFLRMTENDTTEVLLNE